ncbi:MAG: hypothetical protein ABIG68_02050 [Acidobacteriota bacterium]
MAARDAAMAVRDAAGAAMADWAAIRAAAAAAGAAMAVVEIFVEIFVDAAASAARDAAFSVASVAGGSGWDAHREMCRIIRSMLVCPLEEVA